MSEDSGCVVVGAVVVMVAVALGFSAIAVADARIAESRRTLCLERRGYYYEPGLIFRDSTIYCMERPIPVDITPGRRPTTGDERP